MRALTIAMTLLGLAMIVYLIFHIGAEDVAHALLLIGWGLIPIALFHFVPMFFSALSWRALMPRSNGLGIGTVTWIRWIREAVTTLLPVAGVGGDIVGTRLAVLRGLSGC